MSIVQILNAENREEETMIVKQPSYYWIGLLVVFVLIGTVIATIGFTRSDIVNPVTSGTSATATISAVNFDGQFRQLGFSATATAVALAAESDRLNAKFAPTQTAVANAIEQGRKAEEYKRTTDLSNLGVYMLLGLFAIVVIIGLATNLHRVVQNDRVRLTEAQAMLIEKQIELKVAEATMIREQRRTMEVASVAETTRNSKVLYSFQSVLTDRESSENKSKVA